MTIDSETRKEVIEQLIDVLGKKDAKSKKIAIDIEESICMFSKEYAETNDAMVIINDIYNNKKDELIALLNNPESDYLRKLLKSDDCKFDIKKIAFMGPEILNPEKYETVMNKKKMDDYKKNNVKGTDAFTCSKCKKSNCKVSTKQTRSGDEPPTTIITCLECNNVFRFN